VPRGPPSAGSRRPTWSAPGSPRRGSRSEPRRSPAASGAAPAGWPVVRIRPPSPRVGCACAAGREPGHVGRVPQPEPGPAAAV